MFYMLKIFYKTRFLVKKKNLFYPSKTFRCIIISIFSKTILDKFTNTFTTDFFTFFFFFLFFFLTILTDFFTTIAQGTTMCGVFPHHIINFSVIFFYYFITFFIIFIFFFFFRLFVFFKFFVNNFR